MYTHTQTNRSFGGSYPQKKPQKQLPTPIPQQPFNISSAQRKDANKLLGQLSEQYHHGLAGLLRVAEQQVVGGTLPLYVFEVLIERVENQRRKHVLSREEIADLERAKTSLARQQAR